MDGIPDDIIVPPADVREVIDKTAGYISRNGASFEQRMRERQADNKQFQFLFDHDAYYGYYSWKLSNYKEGKVDVVENGDIGESVAKYQDKDEIKAPRELQFYLQIPPMSSFDFDVIKMTASLVAQNGDEYVDKLLRERAGELPLDFLRADHSLNAVFQAFVSQYKQVLMPSSELIERIAMKAQDPHSVLEDAYQRAEYDYKQEKESRAQQEELKAREVEYASIDWHDFVVVQTVEIDDADKVSELPLPLSLAELQYRSLEQKKAHSLIEEAAPDLDIESPVPAPRKIKEQEEKVSADKSLPARPARPVPKGMNIRPKDSSRSTSNRGASLSPSPQTQERLVKSPFSNQMVPESKLKQHIDIAFRDPRYAEERRRYESKVRDTGVSSGEMSTDEILKNIRGVLTKKRGGADLDEEEKDDANEAKKRKVQWDGYKSSVKYVTSEAERSVSAKDVEEQKKRELEKRNKIGPH